MIKKLLNPLSFLLVISMVSTIIPLPIRADRGDFQKGLDYAKSNTVKEKFQQSLAEFKPHEALKTIKNEYTENPPQTGYYSETQSDAYELEKTAKVEVTKDEDYKDKDGNSIPTPGKLVTTTFTSRPIVKISQKEEFMQKGKLVTDNANNIVGGESNKYINCEKQKMSACKTVQVEKTCNEEVRTIRRICEKIPNIKIVDEPYQETKTYSGSITQADNNSGTFTVPASGTITSFSASFLSYNVYRCYNNYIGYLQGVVVSTYYPGTCKKSPWVHNRLSFSNGSMNVAVSAGASIKLSFSGDAFGYWYSSHYDLAIKIDRKRKVANAPIWEESCRDV